MSEHTTSDQAYLEPGDSLESLGPAPLDDEPQRKAKRSVGGVLAELKSNRPALLVIGVVGLAIGAFVMTKRQQEQSVTSNTAIQIPMGDAAVDRSSDDPRVAGLDAKADAAAEAKAREIGGSYMPPLAPLASPPLADVDNQPKPMPAQRQMPMPDRSANTQQAQQNDKRTKAIEDNLLLQLAQIEKRVNGRKVESSAIVMGADSFSPYGGVSYSLAAGGSAGGGTAPGQDGGRLGYPMGTSWQATLPGGADTDRPGTVKAVIEEGPFAGREALCNFTWPSREYLNFECFAIKLDRESLPISMIAVGPDEMPNIKADYNGRYVRRLGGQFLAALPGAYAEGLAKGGTTITNGSATTTTEPTLGGADLLLFAAGKATEPLVEEAQSIANEIKPQAKIPPQQAIRLMLAEDI